MSYNFKSKKIVISAGATGIGWATAKECLEKGAKVFLCDIDQKSINKLKKHPLNNKRLFSFHCDASNENDVILDNCMGSGSTFIACINTNRIYIGIESDKDYFDTAKNWIESHVPNENVSYSLETPLTQLL